MSVPEPQATNDGGIKSADLSQKPPDSLDQPQASSSHSAVSQDLIKSENSYDDGLKDQLKFTGSGSFAVNGNSGNLQEEITLINSASSAETVSGLQDQVKLTGMSNKPEHSGELQGAAQVADEPIAALETHNKTLKKRKHFGLPNRDSVSFDADVSRQLSPEATSVSLTKFEPPDQVDDKTPLDSGESELITEGKEGQSIPSPPPRRRKSRLKYSATFSAPG